MRAKFPEEIYNGQVTAHGRKWFFFDIKTSRDQTRRLVITKSHGSKATRERVRLTIEEADLAGFLQGLLAAMEAFGGSANSRTSATMLDAKPEARFSRAGEPWTDVEDGQLKREIENGFYISDIASFHKRSPGAIRSRIEKLGLVER